ncbi:hypothetical protein JAB5_05660 [Janthinobacterium sp. HH103]|uniref:hypothetical protein n=1 Tax=unclassified Janthinobacterium TaxID=2610881 RepID=UPI0008758DDC|nr:MULTISPECIES: hypothetical protein [unclassified Janthinobacterium]OEZ72747.1 hypothetical protein JAB2_03500 [Janthinobacterium sp. HH100]OEZ86753.1 hypothetical protein JAB5_05660 [Janthinobacterium sp. HH103]QOU73859.1 hypothetical protein JAB4_033180 [Janthinobacterium sp. HH102]
MEKLTPVPQPAGLALLRLVDPDHVEGAVVAQALAQDLPALHARQLLALLRRLRAAQSNQQDYAGASVEQAEQQFGAAIAAVKAELATRPHIPNKQEAKALRQAAAKRR